MYATSNVPVSRGLGTNRLSHAESRPVSSFQRKWRSTCTVRVVLQKTLVDMKCWPGSTIVCSLGTLKLSSSVLVSTRVH